MTKIMEYMALGRPIVSFELKEARYSAGESALYVKRMMQWHLPTAFSSSWQTLSAQRRWPNSAWRESKPRSHGRSNRKTCSGPTNPSRPRTDKKGPTLT